MNGGLQIQITDFFEALVGYSSENARDKYKTVILKYIGKEDIEGDSHNDDTLG